MILRFDMTELPQCLLVKLSVNYLNKIKSKKENELNMFWNIKCFTSETLGFVKNTEKEDTEIHVKNLWELNEPGRAMIAAVARSKVLLILKKQKGELLSNDQEQFLNEPRQVKLTPKEPVEPVNVEIATKDKNKKTNQPPQVIKIVPPPEMRPTATVYNHFSTDPTHKNRYVDLTKPEYHPSKAIKEFVNYCFKDRKYFRDSSLTDKNFVSNVIFAKQIYRRL